MMQFLLRNNKLLGNMRLSELMNIDPNVGVPEPAETVAGGDAAGGGDAGIPGVGGGGGDEGGGGGLL